MFLLSMCLLPRAEPGARRFIWISLPWVTGVYIHTPGSWFSAFSMPLVRNQIRYRVLRTKTSTYITCHHCRYQLCLLSHTIRGFQCKTATGIWFLLQIMLISSSTHFHYRRPRWSNDQSANDPTDCFYCCCFVLLCFLRYACIHHGSGGSYCS